MVAALNCGNRKQQKPIVLLPALPAQAPKPPDFGVFGPLLIAARGTRESASVRSWLGLSAGLRHAALIAVAVLIRFDVLTF